VWEKERERGREQEEWCEKSLSPVLSATFCLFLSLRQENLYFRTAAKLIFPEINSISVVSKNWPQNASCCLWRVSMSKGCWKRKFLLKFWGLSPQAIKGLCLFTIQQYCTASQIRLTIEAYISHVKTSNA